MPLSQSTAMEPDRRAWRWTAGAIGLFLLAIGLYWPTLGNPFLLWDDQFYVFENPFVMGQAGLGAIWRDALNERPHEQYYPLVFTSFWIEHRLSGVVMPPLEAAQPVFHGTQIVLHGVNAVLLLGVLRVIGARWGIAMFVAAMFVVHPVNVASVAWITERKNTLSTAFFLGALLLYLWARRMRSALPYSFSLLAYLPALASKTSTAVLAPLLITTDRLLDGRWSRTSLLRTAPYAVIGVAAAILTVRVESLNGEFAAPLPLTFRPLVAVAALMHYVSKALLPVGLSPVYSRWPVAANEPRYWIALAASGTIGFLLWRWRRGVSDLAAWGFWLFGFALLPVLGLIHFNYLQHAFVADHYLYLAGPGLILAVAEIARRVLNKLGSARGNRATKACLAIGVVAVCAFMTFNYLAVYGHSRTLWTEVVTRNPNGFIGHYMLGEYFRRSERWEEALGRYQRASQLNDKHINCELYSAECAGRLEREEDAVHHYELAIARARRRREPLVMHVHDRLRRYLFEIGRLEAALDECRTILRLGTEYSEYDVRAFTRPAAEMAEAIERNRR